MPVERDVAFAALEERLARALAERDEYQGQVHTLNERLRNQTNAASCAAATAVIAIERIEFYETLITVAADWAGETDKAKREELARSLYQLALAEHVRRTEAS